MSLLHSARWHGHALHCCRYLKEGCKEITYKEGPLQPAFRESVVRPAALMQTFFTLRDELAMQGERGVASPKLRERMAEIKQEAIRVITELDMARAT